MDEMCVRHRTRRYRTWSGAPAVVLLAAVLLTPLLAGTTPVAEAAAAPVPDAVETAAPAVASLSPGRVDAFTRSSADTLQYVGWGRTPRPITPATLGRLNRFVDAVLDTRSLGRQ